MSGSLASEANTEPNLTPILDMVFQLITFFVLVINFKSAALDMSLKLPVVGAARPIDTKGAEDLLILNINERGQLVVYNSPLPPDQIENYIAAEAKSSRQLAKRQGRKLTDEDELPTVVVVRADRNTPFKYLNRIISACQEKGFRNFYYKALTEEPKKAS